MEIHECENTINTVFSKLINEQKYWEILFDKIHIKPASRCQENQVMGYSHNEPLNLLGHACCFHCSNEKGSPPPPPPAGGEWGGSDFACRPTPLSKLI